jgi:hypothetical protein
MGKLIMLLSKFSSDNWWTTISRYINIVFRNIILFIIVYLTMLFSNPGHTDECQDDKLMIMSCKGFGRKQWWPNLRMLLPQNLPTWKPQLGNRLSGIQKDHDLRHKLYTIKSRILNIINMLTLANTETVSYNIQTVVLPTKHTHRYISGNLYDY